MRAQIIVIGWATCLLACGSSGSSSYIDGGALADSRPIVIDGGIANDADQEVEGSCSIACSKAIPADFDCEGGPAAEELRAAIHADCKTRCVELGVQVNTECVACFQSEMVPPDQELCTFSLPMVGIGITGECALDPCNLIFPCHSNTCGEGSSCLRPCRSDEPGPGIEEGLCAFPLSGTCKCSDDIVTTNDCTSTASCICPSCGSGDGICANPEQRESVCADYTVPPLQEATDRFLCED